MRRHSRAGRPLRATALFAFLVLPFAALGAQSDGTARGLDLEAAGRYREAAAAFRGALGGTDTVGALLGLERAYASLGWTDSLLPLMDTLVAARPDHDLLRTVQLRALTMAGRPERARQAFELWARQAPGQPLPYREYSRLLMEGGRNHAADTVLQRAVRELGSGRDVALELAQLRAQLGLWALSARSWREAVSTAPYLQQAAVFALMPTPPDERDLVRRALLLHPPEAPARQALARLELAWGVPDRAWSALAELAPGDSTVDAWLSFAEEAEAAGAHAASYEAFAAAMRHRPSPALAARAASAALEAGRPADALRLTDSVRAADSSAMLLLPLRVRALAAQGRTADAERIVNEVASSAPHLAPPLYRQLAWGWVRAGELQKARAALARGDADPSDEVHGWIALYSGDLRTARQLLRATTEGGANAVTVAALLARTPADESPAAGRAFLSLARGDSTAAATAFEAASAELPDAAPLLLLLAARIHADGGRLEAAERVWQLVVERHPTSPEAAEANLAWARALARAGRTAPARERLEHLILSYPSSALVPQARRELDLLRGAVPPEPVGKRSPAPPPA